VERRIFQNDACVEKPLYRSLNAFRIKICQKWMCCLLPRLLMLLLLLLLLLLQLMLPTTS
jgi:hypothetical protein